MDSVNTNGPVTHADIVCHCWWRLS